MSNNQVEIISNNVVITIKDQVIRIEIKQNDEFISEVKTISDKLSKLVHKVSKIDRTTSQIDENFIDMLQEDIEIKNEEPKNQKIEESKNEESKNEDQDN